MTAFNEQEIDFDNLLKLRTVVARFGELDIARWWNSNGQLGRLGTVALRRGFSRTHHFAQARSVFAIAAQKCDELFNPPGCVTLWKLPEPIEEEFDARWERWLDQSNAWNSFFDRVENLGNTNLAHLLQDLELVSGDDFAAHSRLHRSTGERALLLPGSFEGTDANIALLALGFASGVTGSPVIPYMKRTTA